MSASPTSLHDSPAGVVAIGDRTVRRLGFGAMRISNARDTAGGFDREAARQLVRRAVERGVNFIDTANIYGLGSSEEIIAEAIAPWPAEVIIATKSGYTSRALAPGEHRLPASGRPADLKAECEKSLRRLRVDCIDLYQLHTPDPAVPYEESIGAYVELQQAGKVRHIGVSNVSDEHLAVALALCSVVSVQNRYNLGERESDSVLRTCADHGIAFIPWHPLARDEVVHMLAARIAERHRVSSRQIMLAWLLKRSPAMLPIPGTSKMLHLESNMDAAWIELTPDEAAELDLASERSTGSSVSGTA